MKKTFIVVVETDKKDFNAWIEEHDKEIYSKALDDVLKCVEWDGYTIDIKKRIENLKK